METSEEKWHGQDVDDVLKKLGTSGQGLNDEEARLRLKKYGLNEFIEKRKITPLLIFLRQLKSFLIIILLAATLLSVLIGRVIDAAVIFAFVLLNTSLGFFQEYRAEKSMQALKKLVVLKAKVIRNGQEKEIPARELVPSDLIILEEGDRVPADARLIEVLDLKVDEASLTGESIPVTKRNVVLNDVQLAERTNMVFMGTLVVYGKAKAVVVATGMKTEIGKIAEMIQVGERETPLQLKLVEFGKWLALVAFSIAGVVFALGFLRGQNIYDMFLTSVALAVSAVPEGLPVIVTITLAIGVQRMARQKAIIRKLSAVETLGSTTVICSDKTGTMTTNEMTVRKIFIDDKVIEVTGAGFEPTGKFLLGGKEIGRGKNEELKMLLQISSLCNDAVLSKDGGWHAIGDPTEGALIVLAAKGGVWKEEIMKEYSRMAELPFSSERKMMTTIHSSGKEIFAYAKGAPETVLEKSSHVLKNSIIIPLTEKEKEKILLELNRMADEGLRALALAYKKLPEKDFRQSVVEKDLIFVGLVGMIDPPRKETRDSIELCRQAGIKVVMITGDHKNTAVAVAREIGLLEEGKKILSAEEIDKLDDIELNEIIEDVSVFARVSPRHKLRIVNSFKQRGHIVAVTGDGVNDAPALKDAHIGVAMGIKGTDVAKEASEMVLADDNFATIIKAVEEGRGIYDNIRKFIRYVLSLNFSEMFFVGITTFAKLPLPLLPIQILWINLLTDGLPALALTVDPKDPDTMKKKPRNPKEGVLHGMKLFILAASSLALLTELGVFLWVCTGSFAYACTAETPDYPKAMTMAFTTAIMFELFFVFNCRSETKSVFRMNLLTNKRLILGVFITALVHLMIIYVPFFHPYFGTVPLGINDWLIILLLASSGLFISPRVFFA